MPREGHIPMESADLYYREIGRGQPMIVVHGGPDFDHQYLLPDMDRLSDSYRLIYYDQRGRGASARRVKPEDVTMESELKDLEGVRKHFQLDSVAVLGHSFGAVLAMEYAIRHQDRVSSLILMNPAPASHADYVLLREERSRRWASDVEQLRAMSSTTGYQEGDPDAVAAYYRVHFMAALYRPEDLERVVETLRASFTREGILKARKIEARLVAETWLRDDYDLLPQLGGLEIPTLVISGDHEFIPEACVEHIAGAIPKARSIRLKECGHFSYLECPERVRKVLDEFFRGGSSLKEKAGDGAEDCGARYCEAL